MNDYRNDFVDNIYIFFLKKYWIMKKKRVKEINLLLIYISMLSFGYNWLYVLGDCVFVLGFISCGFCGWL